MHHSPCERFAKTAILIGLITVLFPWVAAAAPPTALVLWYRLDTLEDATVPDASGHGHAGTFESRDKTDAKPIVQTLYGPALKLSKGDGIRVRMTPDLACENALTVMAWVRPDVVNRHLALVTAKGDRVPDQKAAGYRISISWRTAFGELGFGDPEGVRISSAPFSVEPEHWVHIAMTFDGTDMVLYLNAAEAVRRHFPKARGICRFPGSEITIGKYYWHDAYPFEGLLADVRIYNRALTSDELFRDASQWLHASSKERMDH